MKTSSKATLFAPLLLASSPCAHAITFAIEGIVTDVGSGFDQFATLGESVSGTVIYDPSLFEVAFAGTNNVNYMSTPSSLPAISTTITIGNTTWNISSNTPGNDPSFQTIGFSEVANVNDRVFFANTTSGQDEFPGLIGNPNSPSGSIFFNIEDTSAPFDLIDGFSIIQTIGSSTTGGFGFIEPEPTLLGVAFDITSFSQIPEPSAIYLTFLGFACFSRKRAR